MNLVWLGRFFSLWKNSPGVLPGLRVGGLEMWPGPSPRVQTERPDFLLYRDVFARLRRRTESDVLVSIVGDESVGAIRGAFDPVEMLAIPLEWSDSYFESLTHEEFKARKGTAYCLGSPRGDVSTALLGIWRDFHDVYPILAMGSRVAGLLERWCGLDAVSGDAREVLLSRYEGLLYIGCPFEMYAAGEGMVRPLVAVLGELEEELDRRDWLHRAAEDAMTSETGTYYWRGDSASRREANLVPLRDLRGRDGQGLGTRLGGGPER